MTLSNTPQVEYTQQPKTSSNTTLQNSNLSSQKLNQKANSTSNTNSSSSSMTSQTSNSSRTASSAAMDLSTNDSNWPIVSQVVSEIPHNPQQQRLPLTVPSRQQHGIGRTTDANANSIFLPRRFPSKQPTKQDQEKF